MGLSNVNILSVVELVLYLLLAPVLLFLAFRHGRHAILAYFYLKAPATLRLVTDIYNLATDNATPGDAGLAPTILGSVGLSPMILAIAGLLHELHHYLLVCSPVSEAQEKRTSRWLWMAQIQIHGVCIVGMVLLIVGSVKLATAEALDNPNADDVNSGEALRKAGAIILVVLWATISLYIFYLHNEVRQVRARVDPNLHKLATWIIIGSFFVGVRVVYSIVSVFDYTDPNVNPQTGSFAIEVILVVAVTFFAISSMAMGGWLSKDVPRNHMRYAANGFNDAGVAEHSYSVPVKR